MLQPRRGRGDRDRPFDLADPVVAGGRIPPQNLEAERSVLAACMNSRQALREVAEVLSAEDFYRPRHGKIYEGVSAVDDRGEPVDLITVSDWLAKEGILEEVGGLDYLTELFQGVPVSANAGHWARIVKRKSTLRNLIHISQRAAESAFADEGELEGILDEAETGIFSLMRDRSTVPYHPIKKVISETFDQIERLYDKKELITGVPSGFRDLDEMTSGFQRSDLVILAARPSMGKTAFCLNIMANAAIHSEPQTPVLFFSLEMSRFQLAQRILCSEARVESHKLRTGHIPENAWPDLTIAAGSISESPLFIDDTPGLSIQQLRSKARQAKAEHGIGMIIIDYLQLVDPGKTQESRTQEISYISRSLKALARELEVPVMALSQLSRQVESRTDKRPMLSDLRESGAIEQDADVVMFLYRDEYYVRDSEAKGIAEVIIGKQRNGPVGSCQLAFQQQYTSFKDLAREG